MRSIYLILIPKFSFTILGLILLLIFNSCANIRPIQGGPDDKKPPSIVESKSTPNRQLNFKPKKLEITFDEWVSLVNPSQNIIFSPRLKYPASFKLKSKKLKIELNEKEVLQDNTTYSIYLGDAIQDITNRNISKDIHYVFSTGSSIDSFFISGKVIDAFKLNALAKVVVMLYSDLSDSIFLKEPPNYFAITDTSGRFRMDYIKSGMYNLYGLIDKNQNYYYDQKSESIGFSNDKIMVNDSVHSNIILKISEEQGKNFIKEKKQKNGKLKVQFANKVNTISVNCIQCKDQYLINLKDSILFWFQSDSATSIYLDYDHKLDTITVNATKKDSIFIYANINNYSRQIVQGQDFELEWSEPIIFVDTTKIHMSTGQSFTYKIDSVDARKLFLHFHGPMLNKFSIFFDSMSIQGINHIVSVKDSLNIITLTPSSLSKLTIILDSLKVGQQYILQIVSRDKIIEERIFTAVDNNRKLFFPSLLPGNYNLRLIEDTNKNKRWDPSQYKTRTQTEQVWFWELKELRADWDLEMNFKI
ncbi:MAG: Ig-like domain-containing domain [Saprospiraceae bacterium]